MTARTGAYYQRMRDIDLERLQERDRLLAQAQELAEAGALNAAKDVLRHIPGPLHVHVEPSTRKDRKRLAVVADELAHNTFGFDDTPIERHTRRLFRAASLFVLAATIGLLIALAVAR